MRTYLLLAALLTAGNAIGQDAEPEKTFSSGHEYIDLELPSGTKWATYNVGTDSTNKGGLFFAWGETSTKNSFTWETYKHCEGSSMDLKKYNNEAGNGVTDNLSALQPEDDVASSLWGAEWQMPTSKQFEELRNACIWQWTPDYKDTGVAGNIGKSKKNGKTIFFPAMGYKGTDRTYSEGDYGDYWTSTLDVNDCGYALDFSFVSGTFSSYGNSRYIGQNVRAVLKNK